MQMPLAFPAVGDLHRAFFSGSKTAAWPLRSLPCSVQWPFHLLSCKCQWLFQLSGICTELFFALPRLPPGPFKPFPAASSRFWNGCLLMPMALPAVGDLHKAFFSASKTAAWPLQTLPCSVQWPFHLLSCKGEWLCQLLGICTVLFCPIPRPPPGPFKPFPAASCGKCQWFP